MYFVHEYQCTLHRMVTETESSGIVNVYVGMYVLGTMFALFYTS